MLKQLRRALYQVDEQIWTTFMGGWRRFTQTRFSPMVSEVVLLDSIGQVVGTNWRIPGRLIVTSERLVLLPTVAWPLRPSNGGGDPLQLPLAAVVEWSATTGRRSWLRLPSVMLTLSDGSRVQITARSADALIATLSSVKHDQSGSISP